MNEGLTKNLKFMLRYGMWSELANIFRILNELLLMLVWFVALSENRITWGEGFAWLAIIYSGSYILTRLLHSLKWKINLERAVFMGWIVITVFLGIHFLLINNLGQSFQQFLAQIFAQNITAETAFGFWVLFFNLIAVLRGVQISRYPVCARGMIQSFRWIIIILAIFALIYGHHQMEIFLPCFFIFLLSNLAGLSLARVADLSDNNGGKLPGFDVKWAAGIGSVATGVILLSFVFSLIFNLDVAEILGKGLTTLLQLAGQAIVIISMPVIWVLMTILEFLIKLLSPDLESALDQMQIQTGEDLLQDFQSDTTAAVHPDPMIYVMIGVIIIIIVVAIIQLKKQPWKRMLVAEDETSVIEGSQKKINPFANIIPAFAKSKKRSSAKSLFAAARIRHTYAQLMELCDKLGKPRLRSVTPLEFIPRMETLFPENHTDLELITNAYIKIRYGEFPETNRDVEEVLEAWNRINEMGKQILEEQGKGLRRSKR